MRTRIFGVPQRKGAFEFQGNGIARANRTLRLGRRFGRHPVRRERQRFEGARRNGKRAGVVRPKNCRGLQRSDERQNRHHSPVFMKTRRFVPARLPSVNDPRGRKRIRRSGQKRFSVSRNTLFFARRRRFLRTDRNPQKREFRSENQEQAHPPSR